MASIAREQSGMSLTSPCDDWIDVLVVRRIQQGVELRVTFVNFKNAPYAFATYGQESSLMTFLISYYSFCFVGIFLVSGGGRKCRSVSSIFHWRAETSFSSLALCLAYPFTRVLSFLCGSGLSLFAFVQTVAFGESYDGWRLFCCLSTTN